MRSIVFASLVFSLASSKSASACGVLKGSVGDDRTIKIKFDDGTVVDDNGMLVAGTIAADCAYELDELVLVPLSYEQRHCAYQAFKNFRNSRPNPEQTATVKAACGWDHQALVDEQRTLKAVETLKCGSKVASLAKKAAARYAVVADEQASPVALKRLKIGKEAKDKFLDSLREKRELTSQLAQMMAEPSTLKTRFSEWLARYRDLIKTEQFQVSLSYNGPQMMAGDKVIGENLGLALEDTTGRRTMCASPIPQILSDLADKDWPQPKGSAPSTTRGTVGR